MLTILLKQIIHGQKLCIFLIIKHLDSIFLNLEGNYVLRLAICNFFCFEYYYVHWKRQFGEVIFPEVELLILFVILRTFG